MKMVSVLLRLVGLSFLYGLISTTVIAPIKPRKRRKIRQKMLRSSFSSTVAAFAQRKVLCRVSRSGWGQMYLPRDTEDTQEHIDDMKRLLIEVASELKLSLLELREAAMIIEVHETDEWAGEKDFPYIPTREMPRSKAARIDWLREWEPPDRKAEIQRMRKSFEVNRDLIKKWVIDNVPIDARSEWFRRVGDFHRVRSRVAVVVFEIHALQKAEKALVLSSLKEGDERRLEPEAAEAWLRSAGKLIILKPLVDRLEFFGETLVRILDMETKPTNILVSTA